MTNILPIDLRQLYYFSIVAQELNMSKAAKKLFISQPPLTRQIKSLEEYLELQLFERTNKGLLLTQAGKDTVAIIQPLLTLYDTTYAKLEHIKKTHQKTLKIGFTTAFEQSIFNPLEVLLKTLLKSSFTIIRQPSPKLIKQVHNNSLDIAFVTSPFETYGTNNATLQYKEPLILALPEQWVVPTEKHISLTMFNKKPLFWFPRESNPAFFDYTKAVFNQIKFIPEYILEPPEHDVLLAQIAAGEGMGLFASSFSIIKRKGIVYTTFLESSLFFLQLGIVYSENCPLSPENINKLVF